MRVSRDPLVALLVVMFAVPCTAQIRGQTIVTGLRNPVAVVADPTDRASLLVVEVGGLIRVVRDRVVLSEPFLDLRGEVSTGGERGLLGLALAPDYPQSRRFFVNFTNRAGDTVVARFHRRADTPLAADPGSRFDLVWPDGLRVIPQPFSNHNGGHLAFGPDGYLYIGMGDGGSGGDPMNHAQNPQSLLGKMLRIDVQVPDNDPRGYRVPPDNPFLDRVPIAALGEIWAFGLRNPWRYSFDDWTRGGTGALTIGDVGQDAREEINIEPRDSGGRNYGWRLREGRQNFDDRTAAAFLPLTKPIHDYGRSLGSSVTGGAIYRGAALDPGFYGRYLFADFVTGRVFSLATHQDPATGKAAADDVREHTASLGGSAALGMISSFGSDHDGEILVLNFSAGTIVRIVPDSAVAPAAPRVFLTASANHVALTWQASSEDVLVATFLLEILRDGSVIERRSFDGDRTGSVMLDGSSSGHCFRVRAVARSGISGPPSPAACFP